MTANIFYKSSQNIHIPIANAMYDDSDAIDNAPVYNRGDIVWVKLSGCWWPGEVKNVEDVPEESLSQFRKTPLVIVKFFDEDS